MQFLQANLSSHFLVSDSGLRDRKTTAMVAGIDGAYSCLKPQGVFMTKTVLLAGAAALALTGGAFAGTAHPTLSAKSHTGKHLIVFPSRGASVLYDQSAGTNGIGIVSQDFTDFGTTYDAQGADDFTVPAGATWK